MSEELTVHQETALFIGGHRVTKVWFVVGKDAPPVNAYQVNFPRLCLVLSGVYEFEMSVGGKNERVAASSGEAIFIPAHCWDAPTWQQPGKAITFMFAPRQTGVSLNACRGANQLIPMAKGIISGSLKNEGRLMEHALTEMAFINRTSPAAPSLAEALVHHCHQLMMNNDSTISRTQSRWESVCLYLQENFGPEVTRESVAKSFSMTPNHLSRLFRQEGKIGFNGYLTFVRIAQVKRLLIHYALNLDEIAERTGFKSGDYLGRVFRKSTGFTPGEYRTKYIRKTEGSV